MTVDRTPDSPGPVVGIVLGSPSDQPVMEDARRVLSELGVPAEVVVASAHRTPELVDRYARAAQGRGLRVLIAAAGGAAHLAGALASRTLLPVIGVPLASGGLGGLDALLSTVQMPPGVPVATVAIGPWGARNAAILAAQILAVHDVALRERLRAFREALARPAGGTGTTGRAGDPERDADRGRGGSPAGQRPRRGEF